MVLPQNDFIIKKKLDSLHMSKTPAYKTPSILNIKKYEKMKHPNE